MNCSMFRRHVDVFVDGELDPAALVDFERHASQCAPCQEESELVRVQKSRVREALRGTRSSEDFRLRMAEMVRDLPATPSADMRAAAHRAHLSTRSSVMIGLAAAAAIAMGVWSQRGMGAGGNVDEASSGFPIFADVVRLHSTTDLPSDVSQNDAIPSFFRGKVDFPVQPAEFAGGQAKLVGARLWQIQNRRAAALFYDVHGKRVTVVMFASPPSQYEGAERMLVRGRELQIQRVNGYTVPVVHSGALSYAFAGDVGREELLRLASSAKLAP